MYNVQQKISLENKLVQGKKSSNSFKNWINFLGFMPEI
jgi:hypothetical protein